MPRPATGQPFEWSQCASGHLYNIPLKYNLSVRPGLQPVEFFRTATGRYVAALAALAIATGLSLVLFAALPSTRGGYGPIFLLAVMFAAWLGYGPGIMAVLIVLCGLPFLLVRG